MTRFFYGQDGSPVSAEVEKEFSFAFDDGDLRFSRKLDKKIFDFVGMTVDRDKQLIVFPKHCRMK